MLRTITLEVDRSSKRTRKAQPHFSAGWDHQKKREWRTAIDCYTRALKADPDLFSAWANRGMCFYQISESERALDDYSTAFRIGTPELRNIIRVNRGVLYSSLRRYDEALEDFATDDSPEARLNAAYVHLLQGNFWQGLELYRHRPTVRRWGAKLHRLEDLRDKRVVIIHEQGFGDSIMMARFVPRIAAVARSVHWTTRTALIPQLQENLQVLGATFSDGGDVKAAALIYENDAFVLVMDLWQTCGLEIDGARYMDPNPERAQRAFNLLPRGRKIALAWRGRPEFVNDHNRSASLKDFLPDIPGATFVSLQKDLRDDEREFVFDGGALIRDFADTAGIMACCDAVISVDTASAHLAGALGIKCAVVLPYAPDWRWGESGDTTPWYDSVRIFRQPTFGAWAPAITEVSEWLRGD